MIITPKFHSQDVQATTAAAVPVELPLVPGRTGWNFLKPRARKRVLLAGRDRTGRAERRRLLEAYGMAVLCCEDGASAIEMFRHCGGADLLIADFNLPGMSGPELALELTRLAPAISVLLLAQTPLTPDIRLMLDQCGWRYLVAPFEGRNLIKVVQGTLGQTGQRASSSKRAG
jgi:DNA-binding response OmpR family regulator